MKSGSTTLHNHLARHPDIFMSELKEPCFFDHDGADAEAVARYLDLFAGASTEKYVGESSTNYTKAPRLQGVAERVKDFCGDCRIIYIMRDPVARAVSHYWWEVTHSVEGRRMSTAIPRIPEIASVGHYAMQLKLYIDVFGLERIHTLTLEALSATPRDTMHDLLRWLELNPEKWVETPGRHDNDGRDVVRQVFGSSALSHLRGTPLWSLAKSLIPARTRKAAIDLLSRSRERRNDPEELAEVAAALRPRLLRETEELTRLLGRDFPEWTWLYGGDPPKSFG